VWDGLQQFFKLLFTEFVASLECIFESKNMERKAVLAIDSLSSHPAVKELKGGERSDFSATKCHLIVPMY
jgi:hypothetical protein